MTGKLLELVSRWNGRRLPPEPPQEPPPNADAFREDVSAWRAGQRWAAARYRRWLARYFASTN